MIQRWHTGIWGGQNKCAETPKDVQIKLKPTTKASSSHGRGGEALEEVRSRAALEQSGADTQGEGMKMQLHKGRELLVDKRHKICLPSYFPQY